MPYLEKALRRQLSTTIDKARLVAEEGAADAIRRLAVANPEAPAWLSDPHRLLRRTLRAHARSLGDTLDGTPASTRHLIETAAFEHWHRMLFGRFLVERGLLIHPTLGAAIARDELAELAAEEGLPDAWALVERIAAPALPAVFKPHDPALLLSLAPEYAKRLRDLVAALPAAVFEADDSLGWTYQFWRAAEKERVNKAGNKIGAAELPVVTQLFTEPYMVRFLLHNTLGAWHAGRVLAADPALAVKAPDEVTLRAACALPGYDWEFLRFVRSVEPVEPDGEPTGPWRPAAGDYPGWPGKAAQITMLDPCCGSGHFLTEGLTALAAMRGAEEQLSPADAAVAVLHDNLHGLEIDGRCVQIAAFALALTAWRIGGPALTAAGALPTPHVAWVGAPPPLPRAEFMDLADDNLELRAGLAALHDLFVQAPILGSLIDIKSGDLLSPVRIAKLEAAMSALVERIRGAQPERSEGAISAREMADAASILTKQFVLQITNVPFLGLGRQAPSIIKHLGLHFDVAKADLSTAMLQRMRAISTEGGTIAAVTPQNWLFLGTYKEFRKALMSQAKLNSIAILGERGFDNAAAAGAFTALVVLTNTKPLSTSTFTGQDASAATGPWDKATVLREGLTTVLSQSRQKFNPDHRILLVDFGSQDLLSARCSSFLGLGTGDFPRYVRKVWEVERSESWEYFQCTVDEPVLFGGREHVIAWDHKQGRVSGLGPDEREQIHNQDQSGQQAWGRPGVAVGLMRSLKPVLFTGEKFEKALAVLTPSKITDLPALWAFAISPSFNKLVRQVDRKLIVANGTLVKIPFDLVHWQAVAAEVFPNGLPEPYSDDPTQWLFHGHPAHAEPGTQLHVVLAHLAGYSWPAQNHAEICLSPDAREKVSQAAVLPASDADGLLPLHVHGADLALADRVRIQLAAAFGAPLLPEAEAALVRAADIKLDGKEARESTLEAWLRDRAFRQHSKLFHNRPFLWHVWDGLPRDGFSAILHYHRLNHALLEKLTYTVLGDWISRAAAANQIAQLEAAQRLKQKLVAILHGEVPYDIFVRWKPLFRQPIGWNPDLDDGVRLNIRPFVTAGILREQPRGVVWGKDRGTDVPSAPWFHLGPVYGEKAGARINDHHLSLAEKQAARAAASESATAAE